MFIMFISGQLITLELGTDGLVLCHLGNYEDFGDIKIKAKFWTSNLPMEKVVSFYGVAMRTLNGTDKLDCTDLILDIKDFQVTGEIMDGMVLTSYLNCHGEITAGGFLKSQTWHGKDLKMYGDFKTELKTRPKDPRPIPAVGIKTFLCGKLIGFAEGKFFAEIISFDHCSATSVAIQQNQSPAKKIKLGITKASIVTPPKTPKQ